MRVGISTYLFDLDGHIDIDARSVSVTTARRRASRTPTLDGGTEVYDIGFAHGDRSVLIELSPTAETEEKLLYITENHPRVYIGCHEGCFLAIPEYSPDGENATFTGRIISKASE